MKSYDVLKTAATDAVGPANIFPLKGYRLIPLLPAGSTLVDVVAAYEALQVTIERSSAARASTGVAPGVVDVVPVPGPDWVRSPGFGSLALSGGVVGVTYRVWLAEDCMEISQAVEPYATGFLPNGAGATIPQVTQYAAAQAVATNLPATVADGLAVPAGAKGALAMLSAPAGQTITGAQLRWWRWDATLAAWVLTAITEAPALGVEHVMGSEQPLLVAGDASRFFVEALNCTASGAGALTLTLKVL